jgi:chloramphenicol-sensitive protein RarD
MRSADETLKGALYGVAAYGSWGFFPIYWTALAAVPVLELSMIRYAMTALAAVGGLLLLRRGREILHLLSARKTLLVLFFTGLLTMANWMGFVWGTASGQVLQISLGYFMGPLLNVAMGLLILRERLRPWQWLAVGMALAGVANQALLVGVVPYVALTIGCSFALYGLVRKILGVDALAGMAVELMLVTPFALAVLIWLWSAGEVYFPQAGTAETVLLLLSGVASLFPLFWFNQAARRLPYSTVGLLQYIAPSTQFLIAVFLYNETFTRHHAVTFALIWLALTIYSIDMVADYRRRVQREASA